MLNVPLYAYSRLNTDEKALYDKFYNALIHFEPILQDLPKWVKKRNIIKIREYVLADHPEIFWYNGIIIYKNKYISRKLRYCKIPYCMSAKEVNERNKEIKNAMPEFLSGVDKSMSDYDKARTVYRNIISLTDYDSVELERTGDKVDAYEPDDKRSIYGIFVNKKAVCADMPRHFSTL